MEHFRRLAFCMLYLFTFIWQLSAQVKKIPQWERFEIVLQGTAKGNPFADASLTATFGSKGEIRLMYRDFMMATGDMLFALCL